MKKSYAIIKENEIIGYCNEVELDPKFIKLQKANKIEYREVSEDLDADIDSLEIGLDGKLKVNVPKKLKKQGKQEARAFLNSLDLEAPLNDVDETVRKLIQYLFERP